MKFGILTNIKTKNLGDDIQSYAAAKLLPRIDYEVDREHIDTFTSDNNEPVAVVMNGWWMWKKWNWPPADCIIPKLTSMHINTYSVSQLGTSIHGEWLCGCGGEYLKQYGPVGCRDSSTIEFLKEMGIEGYFSGCLSLTLPQQPKTADAGTYACLVDLNPKLMAKAKELLKDTNLEIRILSHHCDDRPPNQTLQQRFEKVEELLSQYQNAKFVITRRLHVTLPCIALKTPVLSVVDKKNVKNSTRWDSYNGMINYLHETDFLSGNFDFDFNHPPANPDTYLPLRESLIQEVAAFVQQYQDCNLPLEQVRKTTYSAEEKLLWQNQLMKKALNKWFRANRRVLSRKDQIKKNLKLYKRFVKQLQKDGIITEVTDLKALKYKTEPPPWKDFIKKKIKHTFHK